MKGKRILAFMLSAALLAGMLPTAALAAEAAVSCENHLEHTLDCGYAEGRACGHTGHTSDCFTDQLLCSELDAAPSDAEEPHEHTQACYELNCPHENGIHDETCGYAEAQPCGHVCELCAPKDSGILSEENDVESTEERVAAPLAAPVADPISGDGYSFDADTAELTITSNDGTTNWKKDPTISASSVQSVVLESGVTAIGTEAFLDCTGLTQVSLPESLTSIGYFAFGRCANLELTTLPSGVQTIANSAFSGCKKLALTSLPENLKAINEYAFNGCESLSLTTLPDQIESIETHAFDGCTSLALTSLPTNLKTIGKAAFYGCTSIAFTSFPVNLTSIGDYAFAKCAGLSALTFPQDKAPTLGEKAFNNITSGLVIFVPYGATGYNGENWPTEKVVYGAALSNLEISSGTLTPSFFPGTVTYSAFVETSVEKVTVIPTAHDKETITVNGTDVTSGSTSGDISLTAGNTTQINVIAKNSDADSRTYTINITRAAPDAVSITGVTLDQTALTLYTNKSPGSAKLTATVQPSDATTKTVTWASSAPYVARVDSSGNVTAVALGSATITATTADGGKTAACAVTVITESSSSGGGGSSSSSGSSYLHRILTDKATGVAVEGDRIHEHATLDVKAGVLHKAGDAGCDLLRTAQAAGRVLCIYDVSLSRAFIGTVTVSIPVEGRDGQTLTIAHCIDGKLALSDVKVKSGSAELQVKELSPFAVLNGVYTSDTLAAPVVKNPFTDVKESDWFYEAVMFAYQNGLMSGTGPSTFDPLGAVTRAQPPVVLHRLEGSPIVTAQNPFADVRPGQWYAPGVTWAAGAGLVDGYNATTYGPGDPVTREQLVAILYRYAQFKKWDVTQRNGLTSYTDNGDISAWAQEAMEWAVGAGLLKGSAGTLSPKAGATRAEFAQMLQRLMETYQPAAPVALAPGTSKPRRHRVQKGDTLWALARRYNCTIAELVAANAMIKDLDFIVAGWTLNIP